MKEKGYTDYNPFSVLISQANLILSLNDLMSIKSKLESYSLTGRTLEIRNADISVINNLLG